MAFSALTSNTPYFQGTISANWLNGGDISAIGGFLMGALVYWLLCSMPDQRAAAKVAQ